MKNAKSISDERLKEIKVKSWVNCNWNYVIFLVLPGKMRDEG